MNAAKNGNGDGKEPAKRPESEAKIEERGEAIPWMPVGWWRPTQCLDRTGRQITAWLRVGPDVKGEPSEIYVGHGARAERFPEGTAVQPIEFLIEGAKTFEEAAAKYDADLAEAGEKVGEEMRKNYTRAKLMVPPGPPPQGHSGTFNRLNQRPKF